MNVMEAYRVLGLQPGVELDVIKKQYRKLMKMYHPDINPQGEEMSKKIIAAYDVVIRAGVLKASEDPRVRDFNQYAEHKRKTKAQSEMSELFAKAYARHDRCKSTLEVAMLQAWLIKTGRINSTAEMWVTEDLRVYAIIDLATSHLANIKKYMERNGRDSGNKELYDNICAELAKRDVIITADVNPKKSKITVHF